MPWVTAWKCSPTLVLLKPAMKLFSILRQRSLLVFACVMLAVHTPPAFSQAAGARGDYFLYDVVSGDTLIALAQRYTGDPYNWRPLQTLNSVEDPYRLPIGARLRIPFSLIPELASQAKLSHVAGHVAVNGKQASVQGTLAEGDRVATGPDGFLAVVLADNSVLSVPANSLLSVERLRTFKGTGLIDTILTIRDGSVESRVAPHENGVGRFEVRTPVSITGVRGTHLRVRTADGAAQSEVISGSAQVGSGNEHDATLRQHQGAAVDAQGNLIGVRALLPAPELPPAKRGSQGWALEFPPVSGATSYLVRVAANAQGSHLVSSRLFASPHITFRAPGAGTHYVMVRAVDRDGVMGKDAVQSFPGVPLLNTSDGSAVKAGFGQFVFLTDH